MILLGFGDLTEFILAKLSLLMLFCRRPLITRREKYEKNSFYKYLFVVVMVIRTEWIREREDWK